MSKFLRELRVISGIAWPTVLYHVHSAPENHGLIWSANRYEFQSVSLHPVTWRTYIHNGR